MTPPRKHRTRALTVALAAPALLVPATVMAGTPHQSVTVASTFASARSYRTHSAVTYDAASVPVGSRVLITERRQKAAGDAGNVKIETLRVWGIKRNTRYDAYAYTRPCGATPRAAGRRTQDGPSRGHYPQNEVWLGFKTNRRGEAASSARQYWSLEKRAYSVVIQSHATSAVVACVTVLFS
jgi:superoxide dismutase, Cu-Zn family